MGHAVPDTADIARADAARTRLRPLIAEQGASVVARHLGCSRGGLLAVMAGCATRAITHYVVTRAEELYPAQLDGER